MYAAIAAVTSSASIASHADAESGESERVAADAAPEVGHRADAGVAQAPGVPRGDAEPGRLLEPGAGEQHPLGEVAELRARPHAQPRLPDDGRDELGGVACAAQPRHGAGDVGGGFDRIERVEQPQAVGREQRGQLGHVHPVSLGANPQTAASPTDPLSAPSNPYPTPHKPRDHPRCRRSALVPDSYQRAARHSTNRGKIMAVEDNANLLGLQANLEDSLTPTTRPTSISKSNIEDSVNADNSDERLPVEQHRQLGRQLDVGRLGQRRPTPRSRSRTRSNDNSSNADDSFNDNSDNNSNNEDDSYHDSINDSFQVNDSFQDNSINISDSYNDDSVNAGIRQYNSGFNDLNILDASEGGGGMAKGWRRRWRPRRRDRRPFDHDRPVGEPEHLDLVGQRRRGHRGRRLG